MASQLQWSPRAMSPQTLRAQQAGCNVESTLSAPLVVCDPMWNCNVMATKVCEKNGPWQGRGKECPMSVGSTRCGG